MERFREFRSRNLKKVGWFCLKLGISANIATTISLILGLVSVYFFENLDLFILFAVLHLIADGMDGVIARVSISTKFGKYYDYVTDNLIVSLLLLIKLWFYVDDYYVLIVIGLYVLSHIIYILSKLEYPILFCRLMLIIMLALNLPTLAYLAVGVVSAYTLAMQLQKSMMTKERERNRTEIRREL